MAQFLWTEDLHTNNALIDGEHRRLIDLLNALFRTMEDGAASSLLSKAMNDLFVCAREHFEHEEAEMERIRYVAALAHHAEHAKLLQQLGGLKQMLDAGGRINVPAVADFLSAWLRDHILASDLRLATALKPERSAARATEPH
jgi:hemerythrin-like metal-binding protein